MINTLKTKDQWMLDIIDLRIQEDAHNELNRANLKLASLTHNADFVETYQNAALAELSNAFKTNRMIKKWKSTQKNRDGTTST